MMILTQKDRNSGTLEFVIDRFNVQAKFVEIAYSENESFQNLCEDYAICTKALENWKQSDLAKAGQRYEEYTVLLAELEIEIQTLLRAFETASNSESRK